MTDHRKWLKIRWELYHQMQNQVLRRLGEEKGELKLYRQNYEREFERKWKAVTKQELLLNLTSKKIILLADFHAMMQSQKAHLRLLQELIKKRRKFILFLECFDWTDQEHLDYFLNGEISEKEFLLRVRWQEKWGFPFEQYKLYLQWARRHHVRVFGINSNHLSQGKNILKKRDRFAAEKICQNLKANVDCQMIVIYGDLHMASDHLPAEIIKLLGKSVENQIARVFQNAEKIYFQLLKNEKDQTVDIVQIRKNTFCLMSVPPWVKWQNYLMYLEDRYDPLFEDGDSQIQDFTDHVSKFVEIIGTELGFKIKKDKLSVYSAKDENFWQHLARHFNKSQLKWLEILIEEEMSFYLPEISVGYLARGSVNHAAGLAMQYVHSETSKRRQSPLKFPDYFIEQVWLEAVGYFGSKLINHKRKADTLEDIKASLAARSPVDGGREPYQLALSQKMAELLFLSKKRRNLSWLKRQKKFRPKRLSSYLQAARLLGSIMGERLYSGYRRRLLPLDTLRDFLQKPVDEDNFELVYFKLLEIIETLPIGFRSKKEKL